MSERCERTSERRSEWPSTLRVDFMAILPNVECHENCSLYRATVEIKTPLVAFRVTTSHTALAKDKKILKMERYRTHQFHMSSNHDTRPMGAKPTESSIF